MDPPIPFVEHWQISQLGIQCSRLFLGLFFLFQPDGGIRQLSIDMIPVGEGGVVPLWQVRNQHYWTWDYAQVKVKTDQSFIFLITAERGDNSGDF